MHVPMVESSDDGALCHWANIMCCLQLTLGTRAALNLDCYLGPRPFLILGHGSPAYGPMLTPLLVNPS
jgi:hypothetical protein